MYRDIGKEHGNYDFGVRFGMQSHLITWVVVKVMVPFWILIIIRHLIFRVIRKGP